jgi:hypothetical protein
VNSEFLAELVVRVMADEDVSTLLGGRPRLHPGPRCVRCAGRVMRGLAPFPTAARREEDLRQGQRFQRRHRRHRRHARADASRGSSELPFR